MQSCLAEEGDGEGGGGGENTPRLFIKAREAAMVANRSQFSHLSSSFLPATVCPDCGLAVAACSRIMMLLSAPPLRGSDVTMVGLPRRRRGKKEEVFCSLLTQQSKGHLSLMTSSASIGRP